jgi:2-keto-4-pentenoate hydratase/2-oxohepta-3-ene-1,7-dioic acid hydratase in catechol pathway
MKGKRVLKLSAILLGVIVIAAVVFVIYSSIISRLPFNEMLAPDALDSIEIADPHEALTFARYRKKGRLKILLVHDYESGIVTGMNLNDYFKTDQDNPIDLFNTYGYSDILNAASSASDVTSISAAELEIPFEPTGPHIGIGANYVAHSEESNAGDDPFVFPKTVDASHFASEVSMYKSPRLDYEAELGFVAFKDISPNADFPEFVGLVLCNDFTDRWTLIRQLNLSKPMGCTGFPDAKGKSGFLPIGNLFVIPRDMEAFYPEIELTLYVNERLRQRAKAGLMIWNPQRIIRQIFLHSNREFLSDRGSIPLLPDTGNIAAGTIILSGTPAGVIFRPVNIWNGRLYLAEGDEVAIRSDRMGVLRNTIVD